MAQSRIHDTISRHGLKPGDEMTRDDGTAIPGSLVVGDYAVLRPIPGEEGQYRLFHENPVTGEEQHIWLSSASLDALRAYRG